MTILANALGGTSSAIQIFKALHSLSLHLSFPLSTTKNVLTMVIDDCNAYLILTAFYAPRH